MILVLIVLLSIVQASHQTVYSCSSSAACGCSTNSATLTRIVGGETANSQTWGWAVSLLIQGNTMCGGSILSASWILTAAHCVSGVSASQVLVYAGSNMQLTGSQRIYASNVYVHPSYNSATYTNDIALIRLSSALNMADPGISVICLPSISAATLSAGEWPPAQTTVVAVGWGTLSEGGSVSSTLQQVSMQTVSYQSSTCTSVISDWTKQFCASSPCKDTCQGDSGGPLMAFTASNQWVLVGATSNGIGCANANYAGSYTRIAAYQSWINATAGGLYSISTSSALTSSTTEINSSAKCSAHIHHVSKLVLLVVLVIFVLHAIINLI